MHSAALLLLVGLAAAQHPTYIDGVPDHEQPWVAVCKNHCHLDGAPVFHNALKYSCNNYRFVMPKPRVFSRCRNGFIDGMELACHEFCVTGRHSSSAAEQKAAQFCKVYKSELPKPGAHQACIAGHAAGARAAHEFAQEKHAEYKALKAATNATDDQIEEVMEKEAEIEEEITQATPGDVKIYEDERAEALKQMKDEANKEATKTAQELETAREAARAAYEAMKGDEDEEETETEEDSATDGNATEIDL
jgi:hypothetical protein